MINKQSSLLIATLVMSVSVQAKDDADPVGFIKSMPYHQVVRELALSRCLAQISTEDKAFSLDAARTANALREWIPLNMENGDSKINKLIDAYKDRVNPSHSEISNASKGPTLNCLRMYHSKQLATLSHQVIVGDATRTWYQDNP
ncbi:hypothetical protein J2125_001968 [Erwinia toletana]|uniref:Uncharacterized protein n=1 Tax=Winslowiella toletana TaxID=92490 RepID=A0ABS4P9I0_9GAMM|nr:T6SS amidase immunity protein Tai4 family protein [Winslowiella toletana]MBP2168776.1 hypothetical protein [Winslowiella toletana]